MSDTATKAAQVVFADDDVLLREGLLKLLERAGFEVIGRAGDASELVSLVRAFVPDLIIEPRVAHASAPHPLRLAGIASNGWRQR